MDQIFVFFPDDEKVGVKPIRSYSEKMQEEDVKRAIIVIKGGITPFARSAIQELCAQREVCMDVPLVLLCFFGGGCMRCVCDYGTRLRASGGHFFGNSSICNKHG